MNIKTPCHSAAFLKLRQQSVRKGTGERHCLWFATNKFKISIENIFFLFILFNSSCINCLAHFLIVSL